MARRPVEPGAGELGAQFTTLFPLPAGKSRAERAVRVAHPEGLSRLLVHAQRCQCSPRLVVSGQGGAVVLDDGADHFLVVGPRGQVFGYQATWGG